METPINICEWWEASPQEVRDTINILRELIRECKLLNHETRKLISNSLNSNIENIAERVSKIEGYINNAVINWYGQTEDGNW